jgi:hypothetical protein
MRTRAKRDVLQAPALFDLGRRCVFSPCGTYRYTLARQWDGTRPRVLFVMLNPSTADEDHDDPTIRRCIGFAQRWGYGAADVGNIFALRSTDPALLYTHGKPVGKDNDEHLRELARRAERVVVAWGNHGAHMGRGAQVLDMLGRAGVVPRCFGLTATGHPLHPLYQPRDARLRRIDEAAA